MIARIERVRSTAKTTHAISSELHPNDGAGVATIYQGDSYIKAIQLDLNAIEPVARLQTDGILGPKTRAAVVAFQEGHSLVDDWQPGSRTRALLSSLASHAD
jgi:peptidoglycan hydrolase-like protein with peptidoglycan-binding domain